MFLWLLLAPFMGYSQSVIQVFDTVKVFSRGNLPAYQVDIPETKGKDIDKSWNSYLKDLSNSKIKNDKGELTLGGVMYKNISPKPMIVYSKTLETQNGVRLTVAFTADSGSTYISRRNAEQDLAVKKFLHDFAAEQYRVVAKKQLSEQEAALQKLEDKLRENVRKEEKARKTIEEKKRTISRNQEDIKTNETDVKLSNEGLEKQKRAAESARNTSPEAQKVEEKKLKELESDHKKLISKGEKLHKEIDNCQSDIRQAERDIEESKQNQKVITEEIANQKKTVKQAEDKLKAIK